MVKTGKEVSKSSFIIFTALIRIGVTVKKTFPHSPHLLCGHIKSFENYWKTALTKNANPLRRHLKHIFHILTLVSYTIQFMMA